MIKGFVKSIFRNKARFKKTSYAQAGEDLIMNGIFEQLKIKKPTYLDIGAHHPYYLSNTYYFYSKGSRGVNVEPDPFLIKRFEEERRNDTNLNCGIGFISKKQMADFHIITERALNTFSAEEAKKIEAYGTYKVEQVLKIPMVSVNQILEEHFPATSPNIVSIDVEGLDYDIVKSFNLEKFRPEVFCVETLTYTEDKSEKKLTNIIDYLASKGYIVYADTFINTIFVDKRSWQSR